jgi:hypothetical protein
MVHALPPLARTQCARQPPANPAWTGDPGGLHDLNDAPVTVGAAACGRYAREGQESIRPRAGLHILMSGLDRESLANSKGLDIVLLRREPQAAAALFPSADPPVADCYW